MSQVRRSIARVATPDPSKLIRRLCTHWAHKFEVEFDERQGRIALPFGACLLRAGDGVLEVQLEADDAAQMPRFQDVVAEHADRMARGADHQWQWDDVEA
ncbi:DUF2218 domain-containing protein [Thermomonas brevis]